MRTRVPTRRHVLVAVLAACCGAVLVAASVPLTRPQPPRHDVVAAQVGSVAEVEQRAARWADGQAERPTPDASEPTTDAVPGPAQAVEPPEPAPPPLPATTPQHAPPSTSQPAPPPTSQQEPDPSRAPPANPWDALADCESGRWSAGTPLEGSARWDYGLRPSQDGFYEGGLGFHPQTWESYRGPNMPDHAGEATRAQQIVVGQRVQSAQGWGAWPVCSRKVGLR